MSFLLYCIGMIIALAMVVVLRQDLGKSFCPVGFSCVYEPPYLLPRDTAFELGPTVNPAYSLCVRIVLPNGQLLNRREDGRTDIFSVVFWNEWKSSLRGVLHSVYLDNVPRL